jgi:hypothetical protein
MPDPILTQIETNTAALIAAMTTAGGYNYNWETVNEEDLAKGEFPRACIYLEPEETNIDDANGISGNAYTNEAFFRIRVAGRLAEEKSTPMFEINKILNKALDDLKKLFGTNYSLGGVCDWIWYKSSTRLPMKSGDIFIPKELDTFWLVRYTQDRQNPTQPDP